LNVHSCSVVTRSVLHERRERGHTSQDTRQSESDDRSTASSSHQLSSQLELITYKNTSYTTCFRTMTTLRVRAATRRGPTHGPTRLAGGARECRELVPRPGPAPGVSISMGVCLTRRRRATDVRGAVRRPAPGGRPVGARPGRSCGRWTGRRGPRRGTQRIGTGEHVSPNHVTRRQNKPKERPMREEDHAP
jgi:hypothetical protein